MKKFTEDPKILEFIKRAQKLKKDNHRFSDIEDENGNQYVDLVQEGGGVLGVALVGYTLILESAGIRFFSLAGTSAGAINTMMMAGLGKIEEAKSKKILKIIRNQKFLEFVDGDSIVKKLINKALKKEKGWVRFFLWKLRGLKILKILKNKQGLNPGKIFKTWIATSLNEVGITTMGKLMHQRSQLPKGLINVAKDNEPITEIEAKLAIITSDITTHTKAEFPRMSRLYWDNPTDIHPSELVRASMSIPFFFEPYQVHDIPNATPDDKAEDKDLKRNEDWYELARYNGPVPKSIKFVDGGMLSNFPINVFHTKTGVAPRMPTFGVRLSVYREKYSKADTLLGISGAMVSTMRQIHDYDFLLKNPDYSKLICRIDADDKFHWLNFEMDDKEQFDLFELGAEKAIEFLEAFDWEGYKKVRAEIK